MGIAEAFANAQNQAGGSLGKLGKKLGFKDSDQAQAERDAKRAEKEKKTPKCFSPCDLPPEEVDFCTKVVDTGESGQLNWTLTSQRAETFFDTSKMFNIIYQDMVTKESTFRLKDEDGQEVITVPGFDNFGEPCQIFRFNATRAGNFETDVVVPVFRWDNVSQKTGAILKHVSQPTTTYDRATEELMFTYWSNGDAAELEISVVTSDTDCETAETEEETGSGSVGQLEFGVIGEGGALSSSSASGGSGSNTPAFIRGKGKTFDRVLFSTQGRPHQVAFINYNSPTFPAADDIPLPYDLIYIFNEAETLFRKKGQVNEFAIGGADKKMALVCDNTNKDCSSANLSTKVLDGICDKEGDLDDLTIVNCWETSCIIDGPGAPPPKTPPQSGSSSAAEQASAAGTTTTNYDQTASPQPGDMRWMLWLEENKNGAEKDTIKGGLVIRRESSSEPNTPLETTTQAPTNSDGTVSDPSKRAESLIEQLNNKSPTRRKAGKTGSVAPGEPKPEEKFFRGMLRDVLHITEDNHCEIRTSAHFVHQGMKQDSFPNRLVSGPIAMAPFPYGYPCKPNQFDILPYALQGCYPYTGILYFQPFNPPKIDMDPTDSCACVDDYVAVTDNKGQRREGRPIGETKDTKTYQGQDGKNFTVQKENLSSEDELDAHVRDIDGTRKFPLHGFYYPCIESAIYIPLPPIPPDDQNHEDGDGSGEEEDPKKPDKKPPPPEITTGGNDDDDDGNDPKDTTKDPDVDEDDTTVNERVTRRKIVVTTVPSDDDNKDSGSTTSGNIPGASCNSSGQGHGSTTSSLLSDAALKTAQNFTGDTGLPLAQGAAGEVSTYAKVVGTASTVVDTPTDDANVVDGFTVVMTDGNRIPGIFEINFTVV